MPPVLLLIAAYLVGGFPSAYLAGKVTRKIDLREHGSGNLGATNVYRVLGGKVAGVVFVLDVAKGALPVLCFPRWSAAGASPYWALAYGLAAIAGHVRTPYLLWKAGGKGVATAAGVFFALAPVCMLIATGVWAIVLKLSGYVSLASLTAAVALVVALGVREGPRSPVFALGIVVAAFVFWTHRANLERLHRGVEHRVGHQPPAD